MGETFKVHDEINLFTYVNPLLDVSSQPTPPTPSPTHSAAPLHAYVHAGGESKCVRRLLQTEHGDARLQRRVQTTDGRGEARRLRNILPRREIRVEKDASGRLQSRRRNSRQRQRGSPRHASTEEGAKKTSTDEQTVCRPTNGRTADLGTRRT